MRMNAITAAKAPPARSFAHEPPIATANKICRLLITAQPIFSITLPIVCIIAISPPPIMPTSLPKLIISPAAGITAITTISTLPSFWSVSNILPLFLFFASVSDFMGSSFDEKLISVVLTA